MNFFPILIHFPLTMMPPENMAKYVQRSSRLGKPIGPNDLMIAATALVHGAVLITHNTREFSRVEGLQIEDWEES